MMYRWKACHPVSQKSQSLGDIYVTQI